MNEFYVEVDFKKAIRKLLIQKDISVAKLARKADMCQQTIYNYLEGNSEMTAANLEKVINTLNALPTQPKGGR